MARPIAICICTVILALATRGAAADEFVVGVLGQAKVSAESPDGWDVGSSQDASPEAVTAELSYGAGPDSLILITVLKPTPGAPLTRGVETVAQLVSGAAAQASSQSVEGNLKVERFESGAVRGAYFSATDKAPPPGEFKYLSQGIATFGDLAVSFTALSNVDGVVAREAMLSVVRSLRSAPAE